MQRIEIGNAAGGAVVQHLVMVVADDRRDLAVVAKVDEAGGAYYEIWSRVDGGRFAMLSRQRDIAQVDAHLERLARIVRERGGRILPPDRECTGATAVMLPGLDVVLETAPDTSSRGLSVLMLGEESYGPDDDLPPLEFFGSPMRPQKAVDCIRDWLGSVRHTPGFEREKAACRRFLGE